MSDDGKWTQILRSFCQFMNDDDQSTEQHLDRHLENKVINATTCQGAVLRGQVISQCSGVVSRDTEGLFSFFVAPTAETSLCLQHQEAQQVACISLFGCCTQKRIIITHVLATSAAVETLNRRFYASRCGGSGVLKEWKTLPPVRPDPLSSAMPSVKPLSDSCLLSYNHILDQTAQIDKQTTRRQLFDKFQTLMADPIMQVFDKTTAATIHTDLSSFLDTDQKNRVRRPTEEMKFQ